MMRTIQSSLSRETSGGRRFLVVVIVTALLGCAQRADRADGPRAKPSPRIDAATSKMVARLDQFKRAYMGGAHSRFDAEIMRLRWNDVLSRTTLEDVRKLSDARRRNTAARVANTKLYEEWDALLVALLVDLERLSTASPQAGSFYAEFTRRRGDPESGFAALEHELRSLADRHFEEGDRLLALLSDCRSYEIDEAGAFTFRGRKADSCKSRWEAQVTTLNQIVDGKRRVKRLLRQLNAKPYRSLSAGAP